MNTTLVARPKIPLAHILFAIALMWSSVAIGEWMKPHKYWTDISGKPSYEALIPATFGNWKRLPSASGRVVSPAQEEYLLSLYSEIYAHSYLHTPTGRVLMLSIAYGEDQTNDSQIHTPDACYPSQGFRIESREEVNLQTRYGNIKAVRLNTSMGAQRKEPLTYFIRVGDTIVRGSKERNLQRLSMALRGYRVDGMLFRVSEVTTSKESHELQRDFIADLLRYLPPKDARFIVGDDKVQHADPLRQQ